MTRLILATALLAALSCGCLQPAIVWPTTVKCLSMPTDGVIAAVKDVVAQDGLAGVFSENSLKALESLARQYGPDVIACELSNLAAAALSSKAMRAPPEKVAGAQRAQTFLETQQITTETP